MTLWGGIEAGGTKFVCIVASGPGEIQAETRFPTTTPGETLGRTIDFFRQAQQRLPLAGIGIASFGPVDPNPASPHFGFITNTPKANWSWTDFAGPLREALNLPIAFDTDVNAAALGEGTWGSGQGLDTFLYLTIGTGIGGGALVNGSLVHGLVHPEMGHLRLPHDWTADPYPGLCPFHGDCWEGLASGPAIEGRWGRRAENFPPEHPAWHLEAHYLALGLVNLILTVSPQRLILGGGVMQQAQLFPLVRRRVQELLNGYLQNPSTLERIDEYIVPPQLGKWAGAMGAISLAMQRDRRSDEHS